MESTTAPAAGWFPDPEGSTSERWWSGDAWTEHTRQPLGDAVPAAFAALVDTLVAERGDSPHAPQGSEYVFGLTPSNGATSSASAAARPAEPEHPGRHAVADAAPEPASQPQPAPASPSVVAEVPGTAESEPAPEITSHTPLRPPVPSALLERASATPAMTMPSPLPNPALPEFPTPAPVATIAAATVSAAPVAAVDLSAAGAPADASSAGFVMPSFAGPVAPSLPTAAADGFIMPNLATSLTAPGEAPAPGRHADTPRLCRKSPSWSSNRPRRRSVSPRRPTRRSPTVTVR